MSTLLKQTKNSIRPQSAQWKGVKHSLKQAFHFRELRPGQEAVIRSVLAGKNVLAIMPTGAGKSLCYQLPSMEMSGTTIVISPLISLMKDQLSKSSQAGIAAVELNSTLGKHQTEEAIDQVENDGAEILYVTPERFTNAEFRKQMASVKIDFIVVDEAHCVSQWGHDFRPAYLEIRESLKMMGNPQVLALTATATEEVAKDIQDQLGLKELEVFRSSVLRDNLRFESFYLNTVTEKKEAALKLAQEMRTSSGIIYTATVKAAEELHDYFTKQGVASILYHGRLKIKERIQAQEEFMNHSPRLLIATNAFGMGIDKADIRFVIHYQFPASIESYYQEAGRAGRDSEAARCILLYLKRDKCTQSLFLSGKYPTADEIYTIYTILQKNALTDPAILSAQVHKKKVDVVLSLLRDFKIIRKTNVGIKLLKNSLSEEYIHQVGMVYQTRKERDQYKLNHVIQYAQSALCRWKHILNYFDESVEWPGCQNCDNCLDPHRSSLIHRENVVAM